MLILPPSIYLSRITSVISDTGISERLGIAQVYTFHVPFSLKNEIILVMSLLDTLDISKVDFGKLMSKQS